MVLTNMNNVTIFLVKIISSYTWLRIVVRRNRNKNMCQAGSAFGVKDIQSFVRSQGLFKLFPKKSLFIPGEQPSGQPAQD
jgi:hypothetical protein